MWLMTPWLRVPPGEDGTPGKCCHGCPPTRPLCCTAWWHFPGLERSQKCSSKKCNSKTLMATVLLVASPRTGDKPAGQRKSKTLVTSLLSHMKQDSHGKEQGTAQLHLSHALSEVRMFPLTESCLPLLEVGCKALGGQAQSQVPCAQRIVDALLAAVTLRGCQLVLAFILLPQPRQEEGCESQCW